MFRKQLPNQTCAKGVEKARKRQKGFTLIEMLAVVIILVIVAAIGFVVVNNQIEKSRQNTDMANVRTIADAVQRYMLENTQAPTGNVNNDHKLITEGYLAAPPEDPWDKGGIYVIENKQGSSDITLLSISHWLYPSFFCAIFLQPYFLSFPFIS